MDNVTRFKGRRRPRHDAKTTKGNAMLDHECSKPVQELKGEFVKRRESARTVYRVDGYSKELRRWELTDTTDTNRCIYVKTGTILFAGFTY